MLLGDDALYYQIVRDARSPDPAVVQRHRPFMPAPAQSAARPASNLDAPRAGTRFSAYLRDLTRRLRPQSLTGGNVCCAPASW